MTNGAFDITIYPLMVEWGFTTGKYKVPSENTLKGLLKNVGSDGISFDEKTGKLELNEGGYERNFEEDGVVYHHIFDPATGYPAKSGLSSVSIVSKDGTMADALSTALFVMGKDEALEFWKNYGDGKEDDMSAFDLILIDDDGRITITPGIKERFSSDRDFEVYK